MSDASAPPVAPTAEPSAELTVVKPKTHRVRGAFAVLLLVLGTVLTPVSISAIFMRTQVTDTDRYVETMSKLASDPEVRTYVATRLATAIIETIDVQGYVSDLLPKRAAPLAAPIANAVNGYIDRTVRSVVESDAFFNAWKTANRVAHSDVVKLFKSGQRPPALEEDNGVVYVDLLPVVQNVVNKLTNSDFDIASRIPVNRVKTRIALFKSEKVYSMRAKTGAVIKLTWAMPFITLAMLIGSAFLASNRRRGFIRAAIGFAIGAALLSVALAIGHHYYLESVLNAGIPLGAARSVFDIVVAPLHNALRVVLTISSVVVVAAILAGPSRLAKSVRGHVHGAIDATGRAVDEAGWSALGPIGFVRQHVAALRIAIAVIACGVLLLWTRPTPIVILWLAVIAAMLLFVLEFLARDENPTPSETAPSTPAAA